MQALKDGNHIYPLRTCPANLPGLNRPKFQSVPGMNTFSPRDEQLILQHFFNTASCLVAPVDDGQQSRIRVTAPVPRHRFSIP